jgi:hypothetical protein
LIHVYYAGFFIKIQVDIFISSRDKLNHLIGGIFPLSSKDPGKIIKMDIDIKI